MAINLNDVVKRDTKEAIKIVGRKKYVEEFEKRIGNTTLSQVNDAEEIYLKIKNIIQDSKESATKELSRERLNKPLKEWMTNEIMHKIKQRDTIHKSWKRTNNGSAKEFYRLQYCTLRNQINAEIRKAKQEFYHKMFEKIKGDMKATWKKINETMGRQARKNEDVRLFESFCTKDENEKRQLIDRMAKDIKTRVRDNLHTCDKTLIKYESDRVEQSIFIPRAREEDIKRIIQTLNQNKAAGWDDISARDLKETRMSLIRPIAKIINCTLENCHVPNQLKHSKVRLIHKGGNRKDLSNYRPISLISTIGKVMERYVEEILTRYLRKYDIIDPNQYGYQKEKGTITLLERITDNIYEALDKGLHTLCIFVDFSRAFDMINHKILIKMLERIGIRGVSLEWFKSYINNRTYAVSVGDIQSTRETVERGVPQGSILGPLLYLLYINDVGMCFKKCKYYIYADDTAIVVSHTDVEAAEKIVQNEFNSFQKWAHDRELKINPKKTKVMHIRTPHSKWNGNINIKVHENACLHNHITNCKCRESIESVKEQKYLGLIFDEHMTWGKHIEKLRKQMRCISYNFFHMKAFIPQKTLITVYRALVESILNYGVTVYGHASRYLVENLQRTQNTIVRQLQTNDEQKADMYRQLNILTVNQLFKVRIAVNNFKHKNTWEQIDHNHETRARKRGDFKVATYTNKYGKRRNTVAIRQIFNEMPPEILTENKTASFKLKIREWVVTQE